MNNPFIPLKNANLVILDGRVNENGITKLEKMGIKVIKTIKCTDIDGSISYHPDIVIHPIDYETIIIAPNVYDYYADNIKKLGIKIIKGETALQKNYPKDIAYNVARLKNIAIHNFKYTDEKLKFYLNKKNLEFINVNQGYAKCSLAIIDNTSAITSDTLIYKILSKKGYNILLIEPGYIYLPNEKYGFIGGATGNLDPDTIIFSGSFHKHPDYERIVKFLQFRRKKIAYLSEEPISDLGTIITFNYTC